MAGSDDLMEGLSELDEARPRYEQAWAYWESEAAEHFDSPVLRRVLRASSGMYRVNIAKIPVVALADRLKLTGMVGVDAEGRTDPTTDGVFQERVWTPNKLLLQSKRLIRNVLILNDTY